MSVAIHQDSLHILAHERQQAPLPPQQLHQQQQQEQQQRDPLCCASLASVGPVMWLIPCEFPFALRFRGCQTGGFCEEGGNLNNN